MKNLKWIGPVMIALACVTGVADEEDEIDEPAAEEPGCAAARIDVEPQGLATRMQQMRTLLDATSALDPERPIVELHLARYHLAAASYRDGCALLDVVVAGVDAQSAATAERLREQHCTDELRRSCTVARFDGEVAR
jgi:hypothetical protein